MCSVVALLAFFHVKQRRQNGDTLAFQHTKRKLRDSRFVFRREKAHFEASSPQNYEVKWCWGRWEQHGVKFNRPSRMTRHVSLVPSDKSLAVKCPRTSQACLSLLQRSMTQPILKGFRIHIHLTLCTRI